MTVSERSKVHITGVYSSATLACPASGVTPRTNRVDVFIEHWFDITFKFPLMLNV